MEVLILALRHKPQHAFPWSTYINNIRVRSDRRLQVSGQEVPSPLLRKQIHPSSILDDDDDLTAEIPPLCVCVWCDVLALPVVELVTSWKLLLILYHQRTNA